MSPQLYHVFGELTGSIRLPPIYLFQFIDSQGTSVVLNGKDRIEAFKYSGCLNITKPFALFSVVFQEEITSQLSCHPPGLGNVSSTSGVISVPWFGFFTASMLCG